MKNFFQKPFRWAAVFSGITAFSVTFVLLQTFVIPREGTALAAAAVSPATSGAAATSDTTVAADTSAASGSSPVITETSYKDDNIQITIETVRKYNTNIYIADIQVTDAAYLKTAFAKGVYGRNIKETTSAMAAENNAIFAINGDYYGFRDYGFVVRNGVLYRETARTSGSDEALAIDSSGNFSIINESRTNARSLINEGVWQVLSFGPALINNGKVTVTTSSEVDQAMISNPRTAIGQISALHYIVIVSDGRTDESAGLSLLELAQEFKEKGCNVVYNLDGGGSSTMWFNGRVVNNPATTGNTTSQRSVSDIVYFGY